MCSGWTFAGQRSMYAWYWLLPLQMWSGPGPFGGAVKVCIICLWARLVRSWYQLGATWIQLGPNLASIPANMWKLRLKWLQSDQKVSIERLVHIRKSSKSIGKMCISEKRGRHSQSYVEVILSIENVPKIYQKSAPDQHQVHPCCFLVAPSLLPCCFSQPCWRVADPSGGP